MENQQPPRENPVQEAELLRKKVADLEKLVLEQEEKGRQFSHLASFPELNPHPVLEVDSEGTLLYINPAAKRLFPDLETRGSRHPWFEDWNSLRLWAQGNLGDSWSREIPIGSVWFEQKIYVDREKKSLRFYGFDITERKQSERDLQKSEEQLRAVVENLPVGIWFTDETGKIIYGNRAAQNIWQGARFVAPEEFHEYKAWWAETGVPLRPDDWAVARAVRKGEVSLNEVLEIECFDGTRKFIINSAVPLRTKDGHLFSVVALNEDITDRKRMDQELNRAHEMLEAVTKGTGVIMAAQDLNFCYTFFNQTYAEEIKRLTGKDIYLNDSMIDLFAHMPEQQKIAVEEWSHALRGESTNKTLEFGDPDRHLRFYNILHTPIRDEAGNIVGAGEVAYDITERMRIEEALRHSEARFKLFADIAGRLLAVANPQEVVNELCREVMTFLDCQVFFNFLADEKTGRLRLNAYAGIPEEEAGKIEWLDYGAAVCGCVARDGIRMVAENIFNTPDIRTELVKSYGIQAYACHPLMAQGRVIGTLSFGAKTRTSFSLEDLAVMKTVTDQIAMAMERILLLENLRRSRDELERKVQERTQDLAKANRELVEQSRILEGFFTSTITPLVLLDKDFNFIRVNEAYAKCCGRNTASFPGRNHFDFYPHPENEAIFRGVVETKMPYQAFAKAFSFPDHPEWGTTYWDWTLTPIEREDHQVEYLVFSLNDVSERIRAGEAIRESENQLRILSSQLLRAQENERKRVSRELHDGLQQTLTAIKYKVEGFLLSMKKTRMKERAQTLEPIVSMIQESVREIRRIQANLRPPMLDDLGIIISLDWLLREFQNGFPNIQVKKSFQAEEKDIPEDLKVVIYRIFQESLTNISKHSEADLVAISLEKIENAIKMSVRDNGKGFDIEDFMGREDKERGIGLASMKERVESSRGTFSIDSHRGGGTIIQASWAL